MSVNNFIDFVDVVDLMKLELNQYDSLNPGMGKKVRDCLYSRPYYIYCYFLEIASYEEKPNVEFLNECLSNIPQEDL